MTTAHQSFQPTRSSFRRFTARECVPPHLRTEGVLIWLLCLVAFATLGAEQAIAGTLSVVSVEPAAHSLTASVASPIVVRFDRAVDRQSIIIGNALSAFGRWSGTVAGSYGFSDADRTVTLTPNRPFSAGETVMVVLSHDVKGADGSTLRSAGYSFQFWTRALPAALDFVEIGRLTTRTTPQQGSRAYGGIASDLDRDGYLDITIVNEDTADLRVFRNVG